MPTFVISALEPLHSVWGVLFALGCIAVPIIRDMTGKRIWSEGGILVALGVLGLSIAITTPALLRGDYQDDGGVWAHLGAILDVYGWFVVAVAVPAIIAGLIFAAIAADAKPQRTRSNRN